MMRNGVNECYLHYFDFVQNGRKGKSTYFSANAYLWSDIVVELPPLVEAVCLRLPPYKLRSLLFEMNPSRLAIHSLDNVMEYSMEGKR